MPPKGKINAKRAQQTVVANAEKIEAFQAKYATLCSNFGVPVRKEVLGLALSFIENDKPFVKFILSNLILERNEVSALAQAMTHLPLELLCFWRCSLRDDGIGCLEPFFLKANSLHTLELIDNSIGPSGSGLLSKAFKLGNMNQTIKVVNLDHNPLTDDGITQFVGCLSSLTQLSELSLSFCGISSEGGVTLSQHLKALQTLRSLNLTGNRIGSEGALFLAKASQDHPSLSVLNLTNNYIGNEQQVTKGFVDLIINNTVLKEIHLSGNTLSDNAAEQLADALQENKSLIKLSLPVQLENKSVKKVTDFLKRNLKETKKKKKKK